MRYEQIAPERWSSGIDRTVAVLGVGPEQIAAAYQVTFARASDDLDAFQYAGFRLPTGRRVLLMRYERSPGPGTELLADSADDLSAALREFLGAFDMPGGLVTWVPEGVRLRDDVAA